MRPRALVAVVTVSAALLACDRSPDLPTAEATLGFFEVQGLLAARCDALLRDDGTSLVTLDGQIRTKFRRQFDAAQRVWRDQVKREGGEAASETARRWTWYLSQLDRGLRLNPDTCRDMRIELGTRFFGDWSYIKAKVDYSLVRMRSAAGGPGSSGGRW